MNIKQIWTQAQTQIIIYITGENWPSFLLMKSASDERPLDKCSSLQCRKVLK